MRSSLPSSDHLLGVIGRSKNECVHIMNWHRLLEINLCSVQLIDEYVFRIAAGSTPLLAHELHVALRPRESKRWLSTWTFWKPKPLSHLLGQNLFAKVRPSDFSSTHTVDGENRTLRQLIPETWVLVPTLQPFGIETFGAFSKVGEDAHPTADGGKLTLPHAHIRSLAHRLVPTSRSPLLPFSSPFLFLKGVNFLLLARCLGGAALGPPRNPRFSIFEGCIEAPVRSFPFALFRYSRN